MTSGAENRNGGIANPRGLERFCAFMRLMFWFSLFEPPPDLGEVIKRPTVERHVNAASTSLTVSGSTVLRMLPQITAAMLTTGKREKIIGHSLA
jgi:hypothetical protein